jgi:hypothetical protein
MLTEFFTCNCAQTLADRKSHTVAQAEKISTELAD